MFWFSMVCARVSSVTAWVRTSSILSWAFEHGRYGRNDHPKKNSEAVSGFCRTWRFGESELGLDPTGCLKIVIYNATVADYMSLFSNIVHV